MCESLVMMVLMQPDVALYHIFQPINQNASQSISKRRIVCERNQTRTCEYTTRCPLMKTNLVFKGMDALPLRNRFNRLSVNRLKPAEKTVFIKRITPPIRFSVLRKCRPCPSLLVRGFYYPQRPPGQAVVTGVFPCPARCMPSFLSRRGFSIPTFQLFSPVVFHQFFCQLALSRFPLVKYFTQEKCPFKHEYALLRIRTRIIRFTRDEIHASHSMGDFGVEEYPRENMEQIKSDTGRSYRTGAEC